MKRCVADVPMLQFMQGEERKVQRMYSSSMIGAASYQSFQDAMAIASEELESVKAEVQAAAVATQSRHLAIPISTDSTTKRWLRWPSVATPTL